MCDRFDHWTRSACNQDGNLWANGQQAKGFAYDFHGFCYDLMWGIGWMRINLDLDYFFSEGNFLGFLVQMQKFREILLIYLVTRQILVRNKNIWWFASDHDGKTTVYHRASTLRYIKRTGSLPHIFGQTNTKNRN